MQGAVVQGSVLAHVRPICCKCQLPPCTAPAGAAQRSKSALRRLHVAALQSPQYEERPSHSQYDSSLPRTLRSSIQSVSFNQQLLVVLAVPLAALGVPFILGHPVVCIVLPLVIYSTPGLRAIAAPICTALFQMLLSGLRPSGSPQSEAFPWQQGNTSAWSAPPIDVDYRALPGDSQGESDNQRNNVNSSARQQRWQQVRSSETESTESHRQPYRQQADLQQVRRPTLAARQRQKVSIRPAGEPSLNKQRIVRQARPGQIGVNLNASGTPESRSNVVRALLVVFPFLRDWGGFL